MPRDPSRRIERIRNGLLRLDDEDLRDMIEFASAALNERTGQRTLFEPQLPDGEEAGEAPDPHKQKGLRYAKIAFERFWVTLPTDMKQQKKRAERYWCRIWLSWRGPGKMESVLTAAIASQVRHDHFKGHDGKFYWPRGSTWLNDERWHDEIRRKPLAERTEGLDCWSEAFPIFRDAVAESANGAMDRSAMAAVCASLMPPGPYPSDWRPTREQVARALAVINDKA